MIPLPTKPQPGQFGFFDGVEWVTHPFIVWPTVKPAGASQAAVTLGNTDGAIGGLTISAAYSQAEVTALRNATETLADDVRALSTLVHALRTLLVNSGQAKGSA